MIITLDFEGYPMIAKIAIAESVQDIIKPNRRFDQSRQDAGQADGQQARLLVPPERLLVVAAIPATSPCTIMLPIPGSGEAAAG